MPDLVCSAVDCVFNESTLCTAEKIHIENDTSCESFCDNPKKENKGCSCK